MPNTCNIMLDESQEVVMRRIDYRWLYITLAVLFVLWLIGKIDLQAKENDPFLEPVKVRCTCYIDSGTTASGCETREGIMASKKEWIGCVACVNAVNEDGSIGDFLGYYEILDTGYGRATGLGESQVKKGKTLGTIETGDTIDIWMPTLHQAEEWIDTNGDYVYIKIIRGDG